MVSRPNLRVRCTLLLIIMALLTWLAAVPAAGAIRGYPSQDLEGDPGDGVLEPSADEAAELPWRLPDQSSQMDGADAESLDIVLVPVDAIPGVPGLLTFRVVRMAALTAWRHLADEGRWPYAP